MNTNHTETKYFNPNDLVLHTELIRIHKLSILSTQNHPTKRVPDKYLSMQNRNLQLRYKPILFQSNQSHYESIRLVGSDNTRFIVFS
jgi:hypothetical protein